jgi:hypothetical protein
MIDMTVTARRVMTGHETGAPRRWLIEGTSGAAKVVSHATEVRDLLDQGRIGLDSRVYEITGEGRALRDIDAFAAALGLDFTSEPPVRDHRSAERAQLSEELAILDRPLESDVEYFDPPRPRRKALRALLVLALVTGAAVAGGFAARAHAPWLRALAPARAVAAEASAPPAAVPRPEQQAPAVAAVPPPIAETPPAEARPAERAAPPAPREHHHHAQRGRASGGTKRAHR